MAIAPEIIDNSSSINYNSSLNLKGALSINEITNTSVTIDFEIASLTLTPDIYYLTYQKLLSDGVTPDGTSTTITSSSKPIVLTGLTAGAYYNFTVSAWKNSQYGNASSYLAYKMSDASQLGGLAGTTIDPKKVTPGKSFYVLSNYGKKQYTVSSRTFSSLVMPTGTSATYTGPEGVHDSYTNYAESYYTFGTSFILNSSTAYPFPGAALGFFAGINGSSGYFIFIEPLSSAYTNGRKSIRIARVDGKNVTVLTDTQKTNDTRLDAVYSAQSYAIDIKVKIKDDKVTIIAYINGFKIIATDYNVYSSTTGFRKIVTPTDRLALAAFGGQVYFDYVYANKIDKERYDSDSYNTNIYQGQFSNDILNTSFGDIAYDGNYAADEINKKGVALDEFGTTVREILKVSTKFEQRPAYPVQWSTGDNKYATVLGYKISNFGGEAYVLNNTSTTIPLADGDVSSFFISGNSIGPSGQLEYLTDDTSQYAVKEPVVFESNWLQSETDVKSLANWIKEKVVNKGKIVNLEIFGNPLLSVGDIITIKYTYNGFDGTQKFIITNVSHSYDQGLSTTIVCRTL